MLQRGRACCVYFCSQTKRADLPNEKVANADEKAIINNEMEEGCNKDRGGELPYKCGGTEFLLRLQVTVSRLHYHQVKIIHLRLFLWIVENSVVRLRALEISIDVMRMISSTFSNGHTHTSIRA